MQIFQYEALIGFTFFQFSKEKDQRQTNKRTRGRVFHLGHVIISVSRDHSGQ